MSETMDKNKSRTESKKSAVPQPKNSDPKALDKVAVAKRVHAESSRRLEGRTPALSVRRGV